MTLRGRVTYYNIIKIRFYNNKNFVPYRVIIYYSRYNIFTFRYRPQAVKYFLTTKLNLQ